jgi:AcrR family transcriptional regulator
MPPSPNTQPKRRPRQARSRALVDAILIATESVLEDRGIDRMTTARVAEVAGVSIGSLYQYFPNKEALAAAVVEHRVQQDWQRFQRAIERTRGQGADALIRELTRGAYLAWAQRPRLYGALVSALERVERTDAVEATMARMGTTLVAALEGAPGLRRDAAAAVRIAMSASQGVLRDAAASPEGWFDNPGRAEDLAARVSAMICAQLLDPPPRATP